MNTDPLENTDWGFIAIVVGAIAAFLFLAWLIVFGIAAEDTETWEKTTNSGGCYLHVHDVNNMWLTPGPSYTIRETLCKVG